MFLSHNIVLFFSTAKLINVLSSGSQACPHEDKYYSMPVINRCKTRILRSYASAAATFPSLHAFWEIRCCRGERGGATREKPSYIPALITSPLLPRVLAASSGVWSGGSAVSIPLLLFLVISLVSAHSNRKLPSFQVLLEAHFRISQLVSADRNPSAFAWKRKQERDVKEKKRLTGERGSTVVAFHQGIRGKQKG